MQSKSLVWMGAFLGSIIGSSIPALWGAGMFSLSAILFSTAGALIGIYITFKITRW